MILSALKYTFFFVLFFGGGLILAVTPWYLGFGVAALIGLIWYLIRRIRNAIRNITKKHWWCKLGLHEWEHLETHYMPTRYQEVQGFRITTVGRRIHYRECTVCGKISQYYPNPAPPRENDIWDGEEQQCPWKG